MKSPKQSSLERKILKSLQDYPACLHLAELIFEDEEIQALQDYANVVSIRRLGYNDHGPVHMRTVARNSITFFNLLREAGVSLSLEAEEVYGAEESLAALLLASFLHDVGMTVSRASHEQASAMMVPPILDRLLSEVYPGDRQKQVILRSLALEGILGHMGHQKIHSLEAGIVLVADGCDMEKGRARIPMLLSTESRVGDIHKYSSSAVEKVILEKGEEKPISITVMMSASVGFFQVEAVLLEKVNASPLRPYIELHAGVEGREMMRYL